jgi:hypothetical protein
LTIKLSQRVAARPGQHVLIKLVFSPALLETQFADANFIRLQSSIHDPRNLIFEFRFRSSDFVKLSSLEFSRFWIPASSFQNFLVA